MIQRALTALGRYFGRRRFSERRAWVRQACGVEASFPGPEAPVAAVVTDISRAGLCLLVNTPLKGKKLLTVELPTVAEPSLRDVLVYVHRIDALPRSQWALGCSFVRKLGNEELEPFGAKGLEAPSGDQRGQV